MRDEIRQIANSIPAPDWYYRQPENGGLIDYSARALERLYDRDNSATNAMREVEANPNLSPVGILAEKRAIAKSAVADHQRFRAEYVEYVDRAVASARKAAQPANIDPTLVAIRAGEIRRMIADHVGDDNLKMDLVISAAIDAGDAETLDALIDAPHVWGPTDLISDRTELQAQRAEISDAELGPDIATGIRAKRDLLDRFSQIESDLQAIIDGPVDEIASIAHG